MGSNVVPEYMQQRDIDIVGTWELVSLSNFDGLRTW